ncbi:uncharacterized protein Dwil_GK27225, partial [Drosophila willistoni]
MSHTFELPKTPASTIDGHGYDSSDDDVEITEVSANFKVANIKRANPTAIEPMQLQKMGIATPPQSPPYPVGMPPHSHPHPVQETMPLLSQLLSNSNLEAPQGYMICVPCYLCKQPFNNLDRLKEHLSIHANILQQNALAEATESLRQSPQNRQLDDMNILYSCDYCGKIFNSKYKLGYHRRNHHREAEALRKAQQPTLKCYVCRKQYKRKTFLQLHLKAKHGIIQPVDQTSPSSETSVTTTNSTESITSTGLGGRQIWSTNLLNSLAAAQYNPANEPAQKYMSTSEAPEPEPPRQQNFATWEPEQKYPLRSPFFNPNFLNCDS